MFKILQAHSSEERSRRLAEQALLRRRCIEELRRTPRDEFPPELTFARDAVLQRLGL
jgi:hypothetical protein